MSNLLNEVLTTWGGKLWDKEKYLALEPKNIKKEDWTKFVENIFIEYEKSKKNKLPFSQRMAQVKLYKYFNS